MPLSVGMNAGEVEVERLAWTSIARRCGVISFLCVATEGLEKENHITARGDGDVHELFVGPHNHFRQGIGDGLV